MPQQYPCSSILTKISPVPPLSALRAYNHGTTHSNEQDVTVINIEIIIIYLGPFKQEV